MTPVVPYPPPPPIPQGNPMKLTVEFFDGDGVAFDPTSNIEIRVIDPNYAETIFTYPTDLSHDAVGVYSIVVEALIGGDWFFKGQGNLPDGKQVTTPDLAQYVIPSKVA